MKPLIPVVCIVLGLAGLITMGVLQGGIPELQVHQVLAGEYAGKTVKMQAIIQEIHSDIRPLRFTVEDRENEGVKIDVLCDGVRPDTFKETYDVAVLGLFDPDKKVFNAEQIFTKCPSKYEAEEKLGIGRDPKQVKPPDSAQKKTGKAPELGNATLQYAHRDQAREAENDADDGTRNGR